MIAFIAEQFTRNGWIDHWQTLLGGGIALLSAVIGVTAIQRQIRTSYKIEAERRRRKLEAARGVFPLALSAVSAYVRTSGALLMTLHERRYGDRVAAQQDLPEMPKLSATTINQLKEIIEFADADVSAAAANILYVFQVQSARMEGLWPDEAQPSGRRTSVGYFEDIILGVAEIGAWANELFDFARREAEGAPAELTDTMIVLSLKLMGFYPAQFERLHATAVRRYTTKAKPRPAWKFWGTD